jgi:hypothetical protein
VFRFAKQNRWSLVTTPYIVEETERHVSEFSPETAAAWGVLREALLERPDVLTLNRPAVFEPAKDRPILFSALAWADVLLTLDRRDFGGLLGQRFYGLLIFKPGDFLIRERTSGRLIEQE